MGRPMSKKQQRKFAVNARKDPHKRAKRTKVHTPKPLERSKWPHVWYDEEDLPGRNEEETE